MLVFILCLVSVIVWAVWQLNYLALLSVIGIWATWEINRIEKQKVQTRLLSIPQRVSTTIILTLLWANFTLLIVGIFFGICFLGVCSDFTISVGFFLYVLLQLAYPSMLLCVWIAGRRRKERAKGFEWFTRFLF